MFGYIYKTTNLCNGKIYIGKKQSDRFLGEAYLGSGIRLNAAINKYGIKNFKVELLDTAINLTELNNKEIYYIDKYKSRDLNIGYNIAPGGDGGITWGKPENHPSIGTNRSGENNPVFNKKCYTNGKELIYLSEKDEVPSGFYRGSHCKPNKGRITIYSPEGIRKSVHPNEVNDYKKIGWVTSVERNEKLKIENKLQKQRERAKRAEIKAIERQKLKNNKKPRVAWNKGLTRDVDERVDRIARAKEGRPSKLRGIPLSKEVRMKISKSAKGKHVNTPEINEKRKNTLANLSEEQKTLHTLHRSQSHIGNKHTEKEKQKLSNSMKGKNKGRKYVNKDTIVKAVFSYELENYLNNGWSLGKISVK